MGIAADMEARPRYESKARWQYHSRKSKKDLWEEIRIHNALPCGQGIMDKLTGQGWSGQRMQSANEHPPNHSNNPAF